MFNIDVWKFESRCSPDHIVAFLAASFPPFQSSPLVKTKLIRKTLLQLIQVVFTTAKTIYMVLINPLLPLFFSLPLKTFEKLERYMCCFKTSATLAFSFSFKTFMNRSVKRSDFSLSKYTDSQPSISLVATLMGVCLHK